MLVHIEREFTKKGILYSLKEDHALRGEANYTLGIARRRLRVFSNGEPRLVLRQPHLLLKLLNSLPLLNLFNFSPFYFYDGDIRTGKTESIASGPQYRLTYMNKSYDLRLHNDNKCSLTTGSRQLALYQKSQESFAERHQYTLLFEENMRDSIELLFLICIFIDVTFFRNHASVSLYRREKSIVFNDDYKELANWTPESQR